MMMLIASTGNLPVETWYHVAATYDGSEMRLYLNGAEVGSIAKSGSLSRGRDVPVHIGRSPEGSNYLRGAIDDVRIYSSALSATEISALVGRRPDESASRHFVKHAHKRSQFSAGGDHPGLGVSNGSRRNRHSRGFLCRVDADRLRYLEPLQRVVAQRERRQLFPYRSRPRQRRIHNRFFDTRYHA